MQIKNTTFIQRHVEKIALGSAGLFLVLTAFYYLLGVPSKPFGISLDGAKKGERRNITDAPEVMKAKADELRRKLDKGKTWSPVDPSDRPPTDYPGTLKRLHAMPATSGRRLLLAGALPIDPKDIVNVTPHVNPYFQPLPPMPGSPKAVTGNVVLVGGEDRSYVSVEASFDLEAWTARLSQVPKDAKDERVPLSPPFVKKAQAIAGTYLEREEWMGGKWGGRRRVIGDGQACYPSDQPGPDVNSDFDKATAIIKSILDNQAAIQRPSFPPLDPSSPIPPLRELPKAPVEGPGLLGPHTLAEKPERLQPLRLWIHDLTVESGRKYRYRLVACTLNPLYGIPSKDLSKDQAKANATRVSLAPEAVQIEKSAWVEREVPATSHCFLVDAPNAKKATFEIWKVIGGSWVSASFEVKVGDAVGSKQAQIKFTDGSSRPMNMDAQRVLVDIQDGVDPATGNKTRTAILMGADGRLETHYLSQDSDNPDRRGLSQGGDAGGRHR